MTSFTGGSPAAFTVVFRKIVEYRLDSLVTTTTQRSEFQDGLQFTRMEIGEHSAMFKVFYSTRYALALG